MMDALQDGVQVLRKPSLFTQTYGLCCRTGFSGEEDSNEELITLLKTQL